MCVAAGAVGKEERSEGWLESFDCVVTGYTLNPNPEP